MLASSFILELTQAVHSPADEYRIALYTREAKLDADVTAYTRVGEAAGPGYTPGGKTLAGYRAFLLAGVVIIDWDDPVWPQASITARSALIYNYSKQNRAVVTVDLGKDFTSTNGSFTVRLPDPSSPDTALIAIGG